MEKLYISGVPLIKTQTDERISYMKSGKLYCNKLSFYRDLENEEGDTIVGDAFEATIPVRHAYIYMPEEDMVKEIKDTLIPTSWSDDYVFCMTGIKPSIISDNNETKILCDDIDSFGQKSLLIRDSYEFIKNVKKSAIKFGYEVKYGFVKYYDEKVDNIDMISSLIQHTSNIAFWKRKRYEVQNEFRFVFHGDNSKDYLELPVEGLKELSKVMPNEKMKRAFIKKG